MTVTISVIYRVHTLEALPVDLKVAYTHQMDTTNIGVLTLA